MGGAVIGSSCAPSRNYQERSGPRYAGGLVSAATAGGLNVADDSLRIVTFNIKYAQEIDRAIEILRTSEQLRNPDVVALQEMDAAGVERIAKALGLAYVYYPAAVHPSRNQDFGNAVLVRGEILEDRKLILPHPGRFGGMRRIAVVVTARFGDGDPVRIYSVHFGTPKDVSTSERRRQLGALIEDARSARGPVMVAGDFNNRSLSAAVLEGAGFTWLTRGVGRTISLFSWDHVFVRGFEGVRHASSRAVDSRGASDHRAVLVELPFASVGAGTSMPAGQAIPGAILNNALSTARFPATPPTR
jgi:endonuclease/exonuclease/phosphatase family metal-dependent hydrolase